MPRKSDQPNILFPQTPAICWMQNHFVFLNEMILSPDGIGQGKMIKLLKTNKTTVSQIKNEFIKIGWCEDKYINKNNKNIGISKIIAIKSGKIDDIKKFLASWNLVKQHIFVRPHKILIKCRFVNKPKNFHMQMEKLSKPFKITISHMKNNKQYSIETEHGTIIFRLHGMFIEFFVSGIIIPVHFKEIGLLEQYILDVISDHFNKLLKLLEITCKERKIQMNIDNVFFLKSIHLGILTEENIAKTLQIANELEDIGLDSDDSVYGCDEWEYKGNFHKVLEKVTEGMIIFSKTIDMEE
jgi:hypothetical protein